MPHTRMRMFRKGVHTLGLCKIPDFYATIAGSCSQARARRMEITVAYLKWIK